MPAESMINDSIRALIGRECEPTVWEVDGQWLKRFAEAVDDPNPLWSDERFARKTRFGGLVAPPAFLSALRNDGPLKVFMQIDVHLKKTLNAGSETDLFEPIRAGDVITVTGKLTDVSEKEGKEGKMLVFVFEWTYGNQLGEMVARLRNRVIKA